MNSILTVLSPAPTIDLTVVSTVKTELGITGTESDALLGTLIRQASATIASECNRVFGKETVSETIRLGAKAPSINLKRFPVATLTSVTEDDDLLDAADYEVDPRTGILYRLSDDERSYWCASKIVVAYVAGYTLLTELPYEVERACIALTKSLWRARNADPFAKRVEIPGVRVTDYWVGNMPGQTAGHPAEVEAVIAAYRDYRL